MLRKENVSAFGGSQHEFSRTHTKMENIMLFFGEDKGMLKILFLFVCLFSTGH